MRTRLAAAVLLAGGAAHAGGMFLPVRGVRPTARGGAFVAGADDPGALWWNPAGLAALAGGPERAELLLDGALVTHDLTYTRIDSGGNTLAPVSTDPQLLPLPTLAAEFDLGSRLALGVGLLAPYSALDGFPQDGPQRYSLVDLHHTVLATVEVGLAFQATDWLRLGAGLQDAVVHFSSRMVFSSCPGELTCAPEDPEFDAYGEMTGTSYVNLSGVIGAQASPTKWLTLGAAFQLPVSISTPGKIAVRLPSSGFFNGASVQGDEADVETSFPAMLRAGVQVTPSPRLKIEASFDWEMWSSAKNIYVTPRGVKVVNAAGVGTYELSRIGIVREFNDTLALHLGVEGQPFAKTPLTLLAGYAHESGASPTEYISVFALDTDKHVVTVGASYRAGRVRLDATYGHVFMADGVVPKGTSCAPQVNPIRAGVSTACLHDGDPSHVYVGDGTYVSGWNIFGAGAAVDF